MSLVRFHYGENNINTGPLKEIPEICVDHFFEDDLNSSIFFLSHAHTDHLVGLETAEFMRRLNQPGIKLYCHPLTPILLGSFQRYLGGPEGIQKLIKARKIVPLDVEKPITLTVNRITNPFRQLNVKVTLLSAGHCPGSVMFLFETSGYRILHTGDFRLDLEDLKRMSYLHDEQKVTKSINHLYVDTTFCSTSANLFPNRKSVLTEAIEHIRVWIAKSKEHVIDLRFSAKFAHEYILLELNKIFKQKIHVTPERRDIYKYIPELYDIVTLDNNCQFHLCGNRNCVENGQPMTIRFSSMWYTRGSPGQKEKESLQWNGNNMTVCYSMHSSLEEIAGMIDYLKPRIVTPLVLPKKSELSQVRDALLSATSVKYDFRDYHSSRNVFGEDTQTDHTLCTEERDETYMDVDEQKGAEEKKESDSEEMAYSQSSQDLPNSQDEFTMPKRPRLGEEFQNVWQYKFSPSPKSKSSQGSSDEASSQSTNEGSQDMVCPGTENSENFTCEDSKSNPFVMPQPLRPVKANPKRNLAETDFKTISAPGPSRSGSVSHFVSNDAENLQQCDMHDKNDADDTMDSQRL